MYSTPSGNDGLSFSGNSDLFRAGDGVAAGRLVDADHGGRGAVLPSDLLRGARAELDPRHVAHAHERTVRQGLEDDALEFLDRREPSLGLDRQLELLIGQRRLSADAADRGLDVLALERIDDVARRQAVIRQALGGDPDAHAVVPRRQQGHVPDARYALQAIDDIDRRIVGKEELIVAAAGRVAR